MSQKELETYLKLEEILKSLSKYQNKSIHPKEIYSEEVISKKKKLNKLLNDAKDAAFEIMQESRKLVDSYTIYYDDFERVLLAMENLLTYLSKKIGDNDIMEEVRNMERKLYDPLVKQQGIEEGIVQGKKMVLDSVHEKLLKYGMSAEQIADIIAEEKEETGDIENNIQG